MLNHFLSTVLIGEMNLLKEVEEIEKEKADIKFRYK